MEGCLSSTPKVHGTSWRGQMCVGSWSSFVVRSGGLCSVVGLSACRWCGCGCSARTSVLIASYGSGSRGLVWLRLMEGKRFWLRCMEASGLGWSSNRMTFYTVVSAGCVCGSSFFITVVFSTGYSY